MIRVRLSLAVLLTENAVVWKTLFDTMTDRLLRLLVCHRHWRIIDLEIGCDVGLKMTQRQLARLVSSCDCKLEILTQFGHRPHPPGLYQTSSVNSPEC